MAISVGQHVSAVAASPNTTAGVATAATGSSFFVFCLTNGAFTSLTDNKGNTYGAGQLITSEFTPGFGVIKIRAYLCVNGNGGAGHTWTLTTATSSEFFVVEILGADTTAPLDANPAGIEDAASPFTTNATGTLAQAAELIIAAYNANSSVPDTFTIGGGFSIIDQFTDPASTVPAFVASLVVASTSSVQASLTCVSATTADGFIYSFKQAGGGGFKQTLALLGVGS